MDIKTRVIATWRTIRKQPPRVWFIVGGVLACIIYGLIFFLPKSVAFGYAGETCVDQLVVAPGLQKSTSSEFDVSFKDELRIGSVVVASKKVCVIPTKTPQAGTYVLGVAPYGGFVARTHLSVAVHAAPAAKKDDLVGRAVSAARPLKIGLSEPDRIHQYSLLVNNKKAPCNLEGTQLSCDIKSLHLEQGGEYTAALYRAYKSESQKVVEGPFETLAPLQVTESSIKNDQTVYDKPTGVAFTFDQPVTNATAKLVKLNGEATEAMKVASVAAGDTLTVSFEELPRESQYRLELIDVVGKNGSSLDGVHTISFQTSGGPKVTGVSVGASNVARSARIIVSFDQPIDAANDFAKLARAEGLSATVSRHSDTQLAFVIQGGDCTPFSLVVDKGVKSGSNGELSKEPWKFSSRTICGTSWSIGRSVQGRSIIAHSFGGGPQVILFTAAIHGSEPSSYSTMNAWVQHLQANAHTIPANKRIVVVPNTNPDGIAAGTRNNSRNVNVGRNFPTANWSASIQTASGTLPTGGGTSAGSEPEAAALISLTRQLRPRLEVSFHAQGSLVGANKYGDSTAIGDLYARTVGYRTMYYNAEAVMGYPMTGEYEDWMGEELGIPAILIELPTLSGNYINSQLPALKKLLSL